MHGTDACQRALDLTRKGFEVPNVDDRASASMVTKHGAKWAKPASRDMLT